MKTIEITIATNGESKVETKGFSGGKCREASQFLESALGKRQSERLTTEFYSAQSIAHTETQKEN